MSCPVEPMGGVCTVNTGRVAPEYSEMNEAGNSGAGWGWDRQPATTTIIGTSTQRHLATRIAAS